MSLVLTDECKEYEARIDALLQALKDIEWFQTSPVQQDPVCERMASIARAARAADAGMLRRAAEKLEEAKTQGQVYGRSHGGLE